MTIQTNFDGLHCTYTPVTKLWGVYWNHHVCRSVCLFFCPALSRRGLMKLLTFCNQTWLQWPYKTSIESSSLWDYLGDTIWALCKLHWVLQFSTSLVTFKIIIKKWIRLSLILLKDSFCTQLCGSESFYIMSN